MKAWKFVCFLLPLFLCSAASAVVITDLGFVVGKVSSSGPIDLTYEDIVMTNPSVPLDISDVVFDTSVYSVDGDYISSEFDVTGFDIPVQSIKVKMDCARYQDFLAGFPTAVMLCDVSSISSFGSPTLATIPIDLDIESIVMTENGAVIDASGITSIPFLASASGTGTKAIPVSEPAGILSGVIGIAALFGLFVNRRV